MHQEEVVVERMDGDGEWVVQVVYHQRWQQAATSSRLPSLDTLRSHLHTRL